MFSTFLFTMFLFLSGFCLCQQKTIEPDCGLKVSYYNLSHRVAFQPRKLIVPAGLIVTGTALNFKPIKSVKSNIVSVRNEYLPGFRIYVDDYLQFAPIVAAYGMDLLGVPSKNDFINRSVILLKGELAMAGITTLIKYTPQYNRPDHSNRHSFPSGHTAQAFVAATFLSEEYKDRLPWIPYISYGVASSVGILRMANNKHYLSDVLAGAGIGILTMKVAYWTHKYKWNNKKKEKYSEF